MSISWSDDKPFTIGPMEEETPGLGVGLEGLERLHVLATGCAVLIALAALWYGTLELWWVMALAWGGFAAIALLLGTALRMGIGDLYRQMQYREKFLVFLGHVALLMVPPLTRMLDWTSTLSLFLVVLCLQAIDAIFFGRLLAVLLLIIFSNLLVPSTALPFGFVMLGFCFILLSMRFGHVRFRVEDYAEHRSISLSSLLGRSFWMLPIPFLAGSGLFYILNGWLVPLEIVFADGPAQHHRPGAIPMPFNSFLLNALLLIVIIVGCIILLGYIDKWLRNNRSQVIPDDANLGSTIRSGTLQEQTDMHPVEEKISGARLRIIHRLAALSGRLAVAGFSRNPHETSAEYLSRLYEKMAQKTDIQLEDIFDLSCYSEVEPTDHDADAFEKAASMIEASLLVGNDV